MRSSTGVATQHLPPVLGGHDRLVDDPAAQGRAGQGGDRALPAEHAFGRGLGGGRGLEALAGGEVDRLQHGVDGPADGGAVAALLPRWRVEVDAPLWPCRDRRPREGRGRRGHRARWRPPTAGAATRARRASWSARQRARSTAAPGPLGGHAGRHGGTVGGGAPDRRGYGHRGGSTDRGARCRTGAGSTTPAARGRARPWPPARRGCTGSRPARVCPAPGLGGAPTPPGGRGRGCRRRRAGGGARDRRAARRAGGCVS